MMRRRQVLVFLAGAAAVWGAGLLAVPGGAGAWAAAAARGAVPAAAVRVAGSWGRAIEVPGLGALNTGRAAGVYSVSCASAGNCAAGGYYTDRRFHYQGFVVSERNGRWGKAIQVPGLGALNTGTWFAAVESVSCASAGNCAAGGAYTDRSGNAQAFVVSERNGRWGKAIQVPGLGALNTGAWHAGVYSVSCASAGNCAAGGSYGLTGHNLQEFVVSERNGRWGKAIQVPGLGALSAGRDAEVASVSCGSAGNCAAGGYYDIGSANVYSPQGFVAVERNGRWGKAIQVPGLGGGSAEVVSVSCGSAGNCAAGGAYAVPGPHPSLGFVAVERNGRWGKAIQVTGLGALSAAGGGYVPSVSCASAGNCAAGGYYADSSGSHGFVVSERHGRWGKAIEVPGSAALNKGGVGVFSVSCASAGNCAAGGGPVTTDTGSLNGRAFVAVERHGAWGRAIQVPGLGALNKSRLSGVSSVSCASPGNCAAGGFYTDSSGNPQGFVVSERNGRWGTAIQVPGSAALNKGGPAVSPRCRARRRATERPGATATATVTRPLVPACRSQPAGPLVRQRPGTDRQKSSGEVIARAGNPPLPG